MTRISIGALFDSDGTANEQARRLVKSAEIVVAVDVMTEDSQVVHGRQRLEETIAGSGATRVPIVLEVELDMDTDDLKSLCTLVTAVKSNPS